MEQFNIPRSRQDESRSRFKKCFKNPLFSLVPFELWRDLIASNTGPKVILLLSQTCRGFKELLDNIGENNFNLALIFRKECQIRLARKYLLRCANNNNSTAMFHVGYAFNHSGWGLQYDLQKSPEWFKKAAELGNGAAMAHYADIFKRGNGVENNEELINVWGKKALLSNNSYAMGYCLDRALGTERNSLNAFRFYEASANEGDEFGQYMLGDCFSWGFGVLKDQEKAFSWYLKSAEQGLKGSQHFVASGYFHGIGVAKNVELADIWYKKRNMQQGND